MEKKCKKAKWLSEKAVQIAVKRREVKSTGEKERYGPNRSRRYKKRWQEYTELYQKDLHDPDNHDGMITHLKLDILGHEVKWALENITINKASGGNGGMEIWRNGAISNPER